MQKSAPASAAEALHAMTPESFRPHRLHSDEPTWSNTNCYSDVWIELLWLLGLDPVPAMACALSAQFCGDQWEFVKPDPADLHKLYGIRFGEYPLWRPIAEHWSTQTSAGNLLLVEVDAFHLPDTAGTSYRSTHEKTSIVPLAVELEAKKLTYLHNSGLYQLDGADFEAVFGSTVQTGTVPFPYVDLINLTGMQRLERKALAKVAEDVLAGQLQRVAAAPQQPMAELADYLRTQLPVLRGQGLSYFHRLAFATTRQAGLSAMLAAELCRWLAAARQEQHRPQYALLTAAEDFSACSANAKQLQFKLARVAAGRSTETESALTALPQSWDRAMSQLLASQLPSSGADRD